MTQELYNSGPYQTSEEDYELGSFTIQPTEGVYEPIEARIRGALTYPSDPLVSKAPLVILAHGRHSANIENFRGLMYLAHHLSSHGYICASIDLNDLVGPQGTKISQKPPIVTGGAIFHRAKTILRTIVELKSHPIVGTRANFKNVGLIGHSRGAEAVARAGAMSEESGNIFNIKAVFSIAPVDFSGVHLGLPFFLLYGDLDADVSDGQSFRVWDRAKSNKYGFYVSGAIHNYFSSNWDNEWDSEISRTISRTSHELIAKAYTLSFFESYLKHNTKTLALLTKGKLLGELSNLEVSRLYSSIDRYEIDTFNGLFDPSVNSLGLSCSMSGAGTMSELDMERTKVNASGLRSELAVYYDYHKYLKDPRYEQYYNYINIELSRISKNFVSIFKYFIDASQDSIAAPLLGIIKQSYSNFENNPSGWLFFENQLRINVFTGLADSIQYVEANSGALHSLNHVGKGLRIDWSANDAVYRTNIGGIDFSNYKWLSLRVGQLYDTNKDSLFNPANTDQSFTIAIIDSSQTKSAIYSSQIDSDVSYPKSDQSHFKSALQTMLVPTSSFLEQCPELNLSSIEQLCLVFNRVASGSLVIDDIALIK
ncbi:hypothetical protein B7489_17310 [Vibrio alginolyticus]|uniref:alpha/beta hydrolase family protein n=1 Tax=Vibrio alginolyticus TaxID=663 RepID=UPI000A1FEF3B|nr:hypothetical protein [Vibrio alginolyticus]ELB2798314.1 hypothetical protein [Vibrio alginolyticus]OSP11797.1 hypothetical protein B7489_17310 [Vibrio alginolyticus]